MSGTHDWVSDLAKVTESINNSPMEALGFETPNSVRSGFDEPRIRAAQRELASQMTPKQRERVFPKKETYEDMKANMEEYEKNMPHDVEIGTCVYLDRTEDKFAKADEVKRERVYIVDEILTHLRPVRYKLVGLLDPPEPIPGSYYRKNLRLVPKEAQPGSGTYFKVDHIVVNY
jgi:hypothetical protein